MARNNKFKRKQQMRAEQKINSFKQEIMLGGFYFYQCKNYGNTVIFSRTNLFERYELIWDEAKVKSSLYTPHWELDRFESVSQFKSDINSCQLLDYDNNIWYRKLEDLREEVLILALAELE